MIEFNCGAFNVHRLSYCFVLFFFFCREDGIYAVDAMRARVYCFTLAWLKLMVIVLFFKLNSILI